MFSRILSTLAFACAAAVLLPAATDPFVGTWRYNPAKSKETGERFKIEDLGQNRYKFTYGNDSDTITADGSDQPVHYGTTEAIALEGANVWKVVIKKDGTVLDSNTWTLSPDGKTIEFESVVNRPDGTTSNASGALERVGTGSGWAGTWESVRVKDGPGTDWIFSAYENGGLTFAEPAWKSVLSMKFDGKEYTGTGPTLPAGYTSSGKRIGSHTLEITGKVQGEVVSRATYQVSHDGKTLTLTNHDPGQTKSTTRVYDRKQSDALK
jgi:hypothetical protein